MLALALTAGAVRWEADFAQSPGTPGFAASGGASPSVGQACNRLDAAWLSQCMRPDVVLASR